MPEEPVTIEERAPVQEAETQPVFEGPSVEAASIDLQPEPESRELPAESPHIIEGEKLVRKRRASSGIKRKTVAPRKSAAVTTVKRTRKKVSPPSEETGE